MGELKMESVLGIDFETIGMGYDEQIYKIETITGNMVYVTANITKDNKVMIYCKRLLDEVIKNDIIASALSIWEDVRHDQRV